MDTETSEQSTGLTLQDYLGILRRRYLIFLQTFLLVTVVGIVATLLTRPVYQSTAKLVVDTSGPASGGVSQNDPLAELFSNRNAQTVATQVEVLQSKPLMAEVAKTAGNTPISVAQLKDTNVVVVSAESTNPKLAADAPNTLLSVYLTKKKDDDLKELHNAIEFLKTQERDASRRLDESEAGLRNFKKKTHVLELTSNRADQIGRVSALKTAYEKAQTELASLKAQIASLQGQLQQEPAALTSRVQTSNTQRLALQTEIDSLQIQRVSQTQKGGFTAESPQIIALDARIAALKNQLARQPALVATQSVSPNVLRSSLHSQLIGLQAQARSLTVQEASLQNQLAQSSVNTNQYADWEMLLARMTREHDTATAQDKLLTDKLSDLNLQEKSYRPTARVIEDALVPTVPVRPKKAESIAFSAVIGIFLGICLALLLEFIDDRINTIEEANRLLSLPTLGYVPSLTASDARLLPLMQGMAPASESYRLLRTNINFASVDAPLRTLVVTSTSPGEGKTTTAANLAFAMAMDGKRVILVDTDLRRPSVHKLLELPSLPGLTDVLLGKTSLEATLREHVDMPGLLVLTSGSTPPNPAELLNSRRFRNLTEELMGLADLVIFDSPPVLVAADSPILASQMDGTVMVVETGSTRKGAARQAMKLLQQARANVLGVAYNKMKGAKQDSYYYYYGYQYVSLPDAERSGSRVLETAATPANIGKWKLLAAPTPAHSEDEEHDQ